MLLLLLVPKQDIVAAAAREFYAFSVLKKLFQSKKIQKLCSLYLAIARLTWPNKSHRPTKSSRRTLVMYFARNS